jgi:hypothetical protein
MVVPVSLNQVAGSGAHASANQRTALAADQCASNQPCRRSNECPFGSTVVLTAVEASTLGVYIESSEASY